MGDENFVYFDDTGPLEQTRRSILYHRDRPEETPTYLVELPEKWIDAPRPASQPASRPRRSTIINTSQLSDTREAVDEPLEDYVRRNISSLRRSLAPQDLQQLTIRETFEGEEVVNPATAEDIERDLMDSKQRKNKGKESLEQDEKRENLPEEKVQKRRLTYEHKSPSPPKTCKQTNSNTFEDFKISKVEKTRNDAGKTSAPRDKHSQNKSEVIVMPALKSLSQKSPFSKEQNGSTSSRDKHSQNKNKVIVMPAMKSLSQQKKSPFSKERNGSTSSPKKGFLSPVKVNVSLESSDEESFEDKRHGGKDSYKRRKSGSSPAKRKSSKESDEDLFEVNNDWSNKKHKKRSHQQNLEPAAKDSEESNDRYYKSVRRKSRTRQENPEETKRGTNEPRGSSGRSKDDDKLRRDPFSKAVRSRSSSVCLSVDSSEPYIVNKTAKKEKRLGSDSLGKKRIPSGKEQKNNDGLEKSRTNSAKSRTTGDKYSAKEAPRSSPKRGDDYLDYNKTTNPFGKEEPYSVHYVATKGGAGKKPVANSEKSKQKKKDKDGQEKKAGGNKSASKKAAGSATKVVALRRYHIQIPEHGRPETWFNVRFNMNKERDVEMKYEGPVKINNYYTSNNYI